MKIPIEKLYICHPDIGDNNKSGLNPPKSVGLGCLTPYGVNGLFGKKHVEIAEYLDKKIEEGVNDNPPLEAIKMYKKLKVEGIYNSIPKHDKEKIMLGTHKGKWIVVGGNHRVFALILLGEKGITLGRGNCVFIGQIQLQFPTHSFLE